MIKRGFTLIELLIVISIIAILSTLVYINWANAQLKARDNKRKADLQAVSSALTLYYADNKSYIIRPANGDSPSSVIRTGFPVSDPVGLSALENKNYISKLPNDPLHKSDKQCKYLYLQNNNEGAKPQNYKLLSTSAESLGIGDGSEECKSRAGEFANGANSCKYLQVSSSIESKKWKFSGSVEIGGIIDGCANTKKE